MSADIDEPTERKSALIFAVDDDPMDREMFVRVMRAAYASLVCRVFPDGEHLLDALLEVMRGAPAPIACFVDVKMTGMSGMDVLRWIRAQSALRAVPVVMLSSSDAPDYLGEALRFGAQCYIAKFPGPRPIREIINAAEQYAAAAGSAAFQVDCNLLRSAHVVAP